MIVVETIGVGTREDFHELEKMLEKRRIDYTTYYEDYDPTPYNAIVRAQEGRIRKILKQLDSLRIYYETTMDLPTV